MTVVDVARRTIHREHLASSTTRVLAALSGGPDSMALLHVLRTLHDERALVLAGVVHLNHQLRAGADADERFCAAAAAALGLPFIVERADVRAFAAREGRSVEDAAHVLRHAFFARAAAQAAADAVALGHTRDDQAETFLLRLLRGAGARGLAAMHPRAGAIIRPLLDVRRADLLAFLRERALPSVEDATNADVTIPRNRVRAELLPLLRQRFNPAIVERLAAEAELARADELMLDGLTDAWCAAHLRNDGDRWTLDLAALVAAPKAVAWRALLRGMTAAAGRRAVGSSHVQAAWDVATGGPARFDAPGQTVQRDGGFIVLTGRPAGSTGRPTAAAVRPAADRRWALPVPGEVELPGSGRAVSAELGPAGAVGVQEICDGVDRLVAVVPKDLVAGGLSVRTRRPGDRLKASAAGHRKLQDLLVDRKVPRAERDRIPVVVDEHDRIVWVAGHALNLDFRVSDPAQAVVILRLKGVGGSF